MQLPRMKTNFPRPENLSKCGSKLTNVLGMALEGLPVVMGQGDHRLGRRRNGRSKGYLVHEAWFFLRF